MEVRRDGRKCRSVGRKSVDGAVGGKAVLVNVQGVPRLQTLLDLLLCHWSETFVRITSHSANLSFFFFFKSAFPGFRILPVMPIQAVTFIIF